MYETFEHTADLGLRIRAADLNTLFAEAGQALFAAIVEDLGTVAPARRLDVRIALDSTVAGAGGEHSQLDWLKELEYLLFDWLKELLYRFDAEHLLLSRFEVRIGADGLQGSAWGEPLDRARHELAHEVKAITYHGLRVEPEAGGWLAEVIVDI